MFSCKTSWGCNSGGWLSRCNSFQVDVKNLGCDFYCFSGHKLYGPTGIGVLYGSINLTNTMPPFMCGGDMIDVVKINETPYADPPLRFEAGTPPIVQAIALGKAIDWVNDDWIRKYRKT